MGLCQPTNPDRLTLYRREMRLDRWGFSMGALHTEGEMGKPVWGLCQALVAYYSPVLDLTGLVISTN